MLQSLDSLKWQLLAVTFLVQITARVDWIFLIKKLCLGLFFFFF